MTVKTCSEMFPSASAILSLMTAAPHRNHQSSPVLREQDAGQLAPRVATSTLIYIVDDEEGLAELYTLFLEGTGYEVRAFTHRTQALAALAADKQRPDLLILDYVGHPPPVDQFMQQCRVFHPSLRFLMASGLNEFEVQRGAIRPHRFLQKPFTADEFLREVNASLSVP